jgi:integrase/recombinase XerD
MFVGEAFMVNAVYQLTTKVPHMQKSNRSGSSKSTVKPVAKSTSAHFPQALYQRMSDDLHLNGKADRTRKGYLRAVSQLANYCRQAPDKISEDQLRRYFLHMKNNLEYAYGTLRVALSGVKFFYSFTCKRDWDIFSMLKLQNVNTLPEVITIEQVHQIIDAATTLRMKTYFWTVYSLGLRLNEGLHLEVGDIDAARAMVHIHRGKGAKDRYLPLPTSTLKILRGYWATHRHPRLLFPADGRNHSLRKGAVSQATGPMSETAVQDAIVLITGKLNFGKKVSTHTLRHSYATHLLEAGVSLKAIQKFMGHSSLQTTMIYLHLTQTAEADARSTVEKLFQRQPELIDRCGGSLP